MQIFAGGTGGAVSQAVEQFTARISVSPGLHARQQGSSE
jgi:hypothetical protein